MAFVSLFSVMATLGLPNMIARDIFHEPKTINLTLGTAFLLQLIAGLVCERSDARRLSSKQTGGAKFFVTEDRQKATIKSSAPYKLSHLFQCQTS